MVSARGAQRQAGSAYPEVRSPLANDLASAGAGTERPAMLSRSPGGPLQAFVRQLLLRRDPLSDEDFEK